MSIRYWNRDVVPGGVEPYEIGMDEPHVGPFAVSYKARRPDGTSVFLKQYKSPSRTVDWYHPYIDYQRELKRRIEGNPTISSRTYDFIDMFEADGAFIQVFGYLDRGDNLRSRIDSGIESPRRRWEFATEFLSAIARFHDAGIVHSDLKPENVFLMQGALGTGWKVKIIDFDFTALSGLKAPWLGKTGWVGTPRYFSPEHLAGKVPEAKSDVFTAALICHELLGQGHPYPEDPDAYAAAVRAGRPPTPKLRCDATPEAKEFARLLVLALSPVAAERPAAGELHDALRAARDAFPKAEIPESSVPATSPSARSEAPISVASGAIVLSGVAGRTRPLRLGAEFGRKSLAGIIGEADASLTDAVQFRILRRADSDGWWIASGSRSVTNPPLLNGNALSDEPRRLENGDTIHAASSRKNPDVRKGEIIVHVGA